MALINKKIGSKWTFMVILLKGGSGRSVWGGGSEFAQLDNIAICGRVVCLDVCSRSQNCS
jgi:hypothetical protein